MSCVFIAFLHSLLCTSEHLHYTACGRLVNSEHGLICHRHVLELSCRLPATMLGIALVILASTRLRMLAAMHYKKWTVDPNLAEEE